MSQDPCTWFAPCRSLLGGFPDNSKKYGTLCGSDMEATDGAIRARFRGNCRSACENQKVWHCYGLNCAKTYDTFDLRKH